MDAELSRSAASTIQILTQEARGRLLNAVINADTISDVPEPYRAWVRDREAVPDEDRVDRLPPSTDRA